MNKTEPRILTPKEARALAEGATPPPWKPTTTANWGHENYVCREDLLGVAMQYALVWQPGDAKFIAAAHDLAHTAAVRGEQRDAALALHQRFEGTWKGEPADFCGDCSAPYPCPTARALGVTE